MGHTVLVDGYIVFITLSYSFKWAKEKKTFREWSNFGNVFVSFLIPMVGMNYKFTTRIIPLWCRIPQFKRIGHVVVKKLKWHITHQDKKKRQTNAYNYRNSSLKWPRWLQNWGKIDHIYFKLEALKRSLKKLLWCH